MPRITVGGGPSNPDALPGEVGYMPPPGDDAAVASGATAPGGWTQVEPAREARPAVAEDAEPPQPDAPVYTSMTQAALRDEAKSRGLPVGGSKADLAARLAEHDAANAEASQGGD